MQGEDGRRRRSSFAGSTNNGSENTLSVPPLVLLLPIWWKQLNVDADANVKLQAAVSSLIHTLFFIPDEGSADVTVPDVIAVRPR